MSEDRIVSYDGDSATFDARALAERLVSYPIVAAIVSVVGYIQLVGQGVASALDSLSEWVVSLVGAIFSIPLSALGASESATIGFLDLTGPLAFTLGVAIVAVGAYLLVFGIMTTVGIVRRSIL